LKQDLNLAHGLVVNVVFFVITMTAVLVKTIIMPVSRERVGGYRITICQVIRSGIQGGGLDSHSGLNPSTMEAGREAAMNESRDDLTDMATDQRGHTQQQKADLQEDIFSFLISSKKAFSLLIKNFSIHKSPLELSDDRSLSF
jgi:hypothetical protein